MEDQPEDASGGVPPQANGYNENSEMDSSAALNVKNQASSDSNVQMVSQMSNGSAKKESEKEN